MQSLFVIVVLAIEPIVHPDRMERAGQVEHRE